MFWLEIHEFSRDRQPRWGWVVIILAAVLSFAVLVLVLVSTDDFEDGPTTTVPSTSGPCQPFCIRTPPRRMAGSAARWLFECSAGAAHVRSNASDLLAPSTLLARWF
ncbi:hypothetical protein [Nocardia sp. NBC_00403]|uniref:hypothetical protein n=1 Tax=Nocardia sp. NBC_00403 TaxID=2975990 RepID=UPI002E237E24